MKPSAIALAFCVAGTASVASAHHSLSEFRGTDTVTIQGTVKQFRFVNPHATVILDVADDDAQVHEWTLVMDDRWELVESGFSRMTFQPGDELVVTGARGRIDRESMYVSRIERPSDGFVYDEDEGEDDGDFDAPDDDPFGERRRPAPASGD